MRPKDEQSRKFLERLKEDSNKKSSSINFFGGSEVSKTEMSAEVPEQNVIYEQQIPRQEHFINGFIIKCMNSSGSGC